MKKETKKNDTWKKVLQVGGRLLVCILLAGGIIFLMRNLINKIYLINYSDGKYSEFPESVLVPLEVGENYVAPYNVGNVKYMKGDYESAVQYYYTALQKNPPEGKECQVRINLALALLHTFPFDTMNMESSEEIEQALTILYTARQFLTENGCASEEPGTADGHSEEAEKLKHDIDEMIAKLQQQQSQNGGGGDSQQQSGGEGGGEDDSSGDEDKKEQKSSGSQGESEEEQKQKSLKEQLQEQKKDLDEGNYGSSRSEDYKYIDGNGQMSGYGEGTPW
ncbi:MAG: hypothetical protein E7240_08640 [Lachnospiraceae bacterium]|nr:hypothetical protein [Lachnospiraceae bacterium]